MLTLGQLEENCPNQRHSPRNNARNSPESLPFFTNLKDSQNKIASFHIPFIKWYLSTALILMAVGLLILATLDRDTYYSDAEMLELPYTTYSSTAAEKLPKNGSLLCWVMTSPKYFNTRVPAVNETWLKRCDHGQFFTTEPMEDDSIPFTTVFTGLNDEYRKLFYKTMRGFYYSYLFISQDFDWYMKADDDSYVIVEHLREYLDQFDPNEPYYIGYLFKPFLKNGYNSGGAGYVLSNAAVKLFVRDLYHNRTLCPYDEYEDIGFARCLANLGIFPLDTRNSNEQHLFLADSIRYHYELLEDDPMYIMWPEKRKYEAFAPELITMHHQTPHEIRMIEILLYGLNSPKLSKYHHGKRK